MIDIYAGPSAAKAIKEQGMTPVLFSTFLGASGGPKWFTLFGLDKYLFGEFFKERNTTLNLLGAALAHLELRVLLKMTPLQQYRD